ncbi:receptor-like protein EIX2 [Alnus glutinosa]|uniref:receptor-like protein EIX2 n=1 Tax=Alnus glutinosa TaxID=3517 RepID=UPI002D77721A|nr:receptor-like protein EIX2 [Alnus glutinosa]
MLERSIPKAFGNMVALVHLDLSHNNLQGAIPDLTKLSLLRELRLSNNQLNESLDNVLGKYSKLQALDVSFNSFKGVITETHLSNFSSPRMLELSFNSDLSLKFNPDWVPPFYLDIIGLGSCKLGNLLTGIIPQSIGDMKRLESLNLSSNHLSSVILPSLATLRFLSYLNLSDNNLSGKIPTSTHLQSFGASSYASNRYLCGLPPLKRCLGDEAPQGPQIGNTHIEGNIQEHANSHKHLWFYSSIAMGFIVRFWRVCGSLVLKSSWRHAYFQFLERMGDRLYVTIAINMAKVLRNFKTHC